jgi:hypothetical protein
MAARKKTVRGTSKKARKKAKAADEEPGARIEKALGVFLRPVAKLRKNTHRAMATPRTTLDRLKRDLEGSLDQVFGRESPDMFFSRMLDLIPKEADQEVLARVREGINRDRAALRQDAAGAALLALYDAADAAGPISPGSTPSVRARSPWGNVCRGGASKRGALQGEIRPLSGPRCTGSTRGASQALTAWSRNSCPAHILRD